MEGAQAPYIMSKLSKFYQWFVSWPFDVVTGVMMVALGVAICIWPDRGISGYIQDTFGFPMEYFGLITVVCALELLYKPGLLRFAIFSTPIMIYAGMSFPYTIHGLTYTPSTFSTTASIAWPFVYYIISWVNARRGVLIADKRVNVIN